jgi:D-galactarolactone isomerase
MERPLTGRAPKLKTPPGTVDTHMHFFTEKHKGQPGGPPPPAPATVAHYRQFRDWLGIEKTVIIQPNAYQFDNACLLECLEELGEDARGIVSIRADISDAELERMHALGVRGVRIMHLPGGAATFEIMEEVVARVRPLGWHPIVQFNGCDILDHMPLLERIEGTWILDHTAKFLDPVSPESKEFAAVLKLVDRGNCYVKLSAPYETSKTGAPDYADVGRLARRLVEQAPERCLWASNWPHVGVTPDRYPDDVDLLDVLLDWAPDEAQRNAILADNPAKLYGF